MDSAARFLRIALRLLSNARHEWGIAMMAERAQITEPSERWRFAMGCGRAVISPTNPGAAALLGIALALPMVLFLSIAYFGIQPLEGYLRMWLAEPNGMTQRVSGLVAILGAFLLMPVGSLIALGPVGRSYRSGQGFGANPINLTAGIVIMSAFLFLLTGFVIDQMPCWLGVPNCD